MPQARHSQQILAPGVLLSRADPCRAAGTHRFTFWNDLTRLAYDKRVRPNPFVPCARLAAILTAIVAGACGSPSEPPPVKSLVISTPTPAPGSAIPVTLRGIQYFVDRGSGLFSVPITVTSDRDVQWAQLNVYLFNGTGQFDYC